MKLHILFGQRKCNYPGQYAPELIAGIDEYGQNENPEYLEGEIMKAEISTEFTALAVIIISVPDSAITARLNPPEPEAVAGTLEDNV